MTIITGQFLNSGKYPIVNGGLNVKLDSPLIDYVNIPNTFYTELDYDFTVVNGQLPLLGDGTRGIDLPQSATQNITYQFTLYVYDNQISYYFLDGRQYYGAVHQFTDGSYYTGSVHSVQSVLIDQVNSSVKKPIISFHSQVPNVAKIDFINLIPTEISTDKLPTTIQQLAEILINTPQYLALLTKTRWQGAYNSSAIYQKYDEVFYAGSSWIYNNSVPSSNQTPSLANTAYWDLRASKGDSGGTQGTDTPYDPVGWQNALWSPTANVLRNIIETLARTSQLNNYALLNSPALITPTRTNNPPFNDRSLGLATTQWVGNNFATLDSPNFTGNLSVPLAPNNDNSNAPASTAWIQNNINSRNFNNRPFVIARRTTNQTLIDNTYVTVIFDSELADTDNIYNNTTGLITIPINGYYELAFTAQIVVTGSSGTYSAVTVYTINGVNYTFAQDNGTAVSYWTRTGVKSVYLTAGQTISFRVFVALGTYTAILNNAVTEMSIKRLLI